MTIAVAAAVALLALAAAVGHSVIGERDLLRPLYAEPRGGILASRRTRAIFRAILHLPSVTWAVLGIAVLLARSDGGDRLLSGVAAIIFAASGIANLAALRRPHPGGLLLMVTASLTLVDTAFYR